MRKQLIILGATGSIGSDVIEIVRHNQNDFEIIAVSYNSNFKKAQKIADEFNIKTVVDFSGIDKIAGLKTDLVVNCLSGEVGTNATITAIKAGNNIALANKESLVSEGRVIMKLAKEYNVNIIPIDSEICAIHQCLNNRSIEDVEKIILTCSGGPFFNKKTEELKNITVEQALNHPTWPNMGSKITIDSATLMNKGFEVIEIAVLFGINPDQIEVLVHPQSLVHGMVYFKDGNVLMHAAHNDMKIPISYCLYYPEIKKNTLPRLNLLDKKLDFFQPDMDTFTNLQAAYRALKYGKTKDLLLKNDQYVQEFLDGKIEFLNLFQS